MKQIVLYIAGCFALPLFICILVMLLLEWIFRKNDKKEGAIYTKHTIRIRKRIAFFVGIGLWIILMIIMWFINEANLIIPNFGK